MDSPTTERDSRTIPLPTLPHEPLRVNARRPESCPRHTTGWREESRESYRRLQRVPADWTPTDRLETSPKPSSLKDFPKLWEAPSHKIHGCGNSIPSACSYRDGPPFGPPGREDGEKTERRRRERGEGKKEEDRAFVEPCSPPVK